MNRRENYRQRSHGKISVTQFRLQVLTKILGLSRNIENVDLNGRDTVWLSSERYDSPNEHRTIIIMQQ